MAGVGGTGGGKMKTTVLEQQQQRSYNCTDISMSLLNTSAQFLTLKLPGSYPFVSDTPPGNREGELSCKQHSLLGTRANGSGTSITGAMLQVYYSCSFANWIF